jgi:hypothetical protein
MSTETQTTIGLCPTHGDGEATREIPRVAFPPIVTAVMRAIAVRRRPYQCATCGAPVQID